MPDFIRQGANVTATVLEAAAGQLRKLSEADEQERATATDPPATTTTAAQAKPRPAAGTRSRIANPKAAKKVRSREG